MQWLHGISYLFGGAFLSNAVPHFVSGTMGRPFQSPFAKPPGEGLSWPTINVARNAFNFVVAYLLLCRVGEFSVRSTAHAGLLGLGVLLMGLQSARHFGRVHGGAAAG
jgi:hypothetical protein